MGSGQQHTQGAGRRASSDNKARSIRPRQFLAKSLCAGNGPVYRNTVIEGFIRQRVCKQGSAAILEINGHHIDFVRSDRLRVVETPFRGRGAVC